MNHVNPSMASGSSPGGKIAQAHRPLRIASDSRTNHTDTLEQSGHDHAHGDFWELVPGYFSCVGNDKCCCQNCVNRSNPPRYSGMSQQQINRVDFQRDMEDHGFADADSTIEIPKSLQDFHDDVLFLLKRISDLTSDKCPREHLPIINPSPKVFEQQVAALRDRPRLSTRVKTEPANNRRLDEVIAFNCRRRRYTSDVVRVWHAPNHVEVSLAHAFDKPTCETETFEIDKSLLDSKFAPNPLIWRWRDGERMRPETFEPSRTQIEEWLEKYAKNGEFKPTQWSNLRLDKHRPGWASRALDPEGKTNAPDPEGKITAKTIRLKSAQQSALRLSEYHVAVRESENEFEPTLRTIFDFTKPDTDVPTVIPPISVGHAHDGYRCVFGSITETRSDYRAPIVQVRAALSDRKWTRLVDGCLGLKSESGIRIGMIADLATKQESYDWEQLLRNGQDYSSERHQNLAHYYEYGFKYYPWWGPRNLRVREVFDPKIGAEHLVEPEDIENIAVDDWDNAVRQTFGDIDQPPFGELTVADVLPSDGFFMRFQFERSAARVYRVLPADDAKVDVIVEEEDGYLVGLVWTEGGLESPVPYGLADVYEILRDQADEVRSRNLGVLTIRRRLREQFAAGAGDMRFIRFRLVDGRLQWDIGTRPAHLNPIPSVASSQ